ncbi:MAG: hypothetical protein HRT99_00490 [Mycoplasmatales bacterium]|nr:hypothetical protein [Mycoplasmatales bacterium]
MSIAVIEKLATNVVEIFSNKSSISKSDSFIKASLNHVEKLIGGKVKKVTFVIEPSMKVDQKIFLSREMIKIAGTTVSQIDVENLLELIQQKNNVNGRNVISVQPIKFDVFDIMTKSYLKAPIHKTGKSLTITSAITTISKETYNFIHELAKTSGVEVNQIMLENQTASFANLSKHALVEGVIHININDSQVNVTINKNNAIVASMSYYDYGYKYLIKGIMNEFGCSYERAKKIISAHASIRLKNKRVIYYNQIGSDDVSYTNSDLSNVIQKYLFKLMVLVRKYLLQKKVTNLPIVFSGKLNDLQGMAEFIIENMQTEKVSIYKPLSFIDINAENKNAIGVMNYIEIIDNVLGKQFDTIVHTNPNSLKLLRKNKQKNNWFAIIKNRIGGKYDWN